MLGVDSDHARSVMAELYAPFVRTGKPIIFMDIPSAEMTKYAANAMLATRISFMNEIANLCEVVGANVDLVRKGIGSDGRIGPSFLFPGPGYGGSCFPKDVQALLRTAHEVKMPLGVLEAVEEANERQKHRLFEKLLAALGPLKGKRIAVWGLAFKPQTDDLRESPALTLIEELRAAGAAVVAHDPVAMPEAKRRLGDGDHLRRHELRRARRRRRARDRHRLERVPPPRLRAHARGAEAAGRDRRPEPVRSGAHGALGFTYHSIGRRARVRVLITGAAGFLGSHLCDRFLADGHEVVGLDNFITGHPDNIAHLNANAKFEFVRHNISTYTYVAGALDGVLHFASPASPRDYLELPIPTLKVGALGTHNALGLALAKQARFFLASTSEVYGDPLVHPQPESYWGNVNPVGPRGVYDEAKRFAEALTMAYHRFHGLDTRIVRIFNTYGPRMRPFDGRVVSNFIVQALTGEPLTLYGDGSQTRSFCYVDDEVEGIYRLFMKGDAEPTNIGNPGGVHGAGARGPRALAHRLAGRRSCASRSPRTIRACGARTSRARAALLGWEPTVPLRDGLAKTIEYFRSLDPSRLAPRG